MADEYELTGPGQQFAHLLIGIGKDAAARSLDPAAKTANAGACRIHGGKNDSRRLGGSEPGQLSGFGKQLFKYGGVKVVDDCFH